MSFTPDDEGGVSLPIGYRLRRPTLEDLPAVAAFLTVVTTEEFGSPDYPESTLRDDWEELDLSHDAWLVLAPDGTIAGYAALYQEDQSLFEADGYVRPGHTGRGIGAYLVGVMEGRARALLTQAPPGTAVTLQNTVNPQNQAARRLLEAAGYSTARYFWRMVADVDGAHPPHAWPDGITVRTWVSSADDQPVYETIEEAFQDHWGHIPPDFEDWQRKPEGFDPGLWLLAHDGQELAGALLGRHYLGMGWVQQLGIRRPWRRRGLGLALLQQAFVEFARRGWPQAGLDVDAESETGATRLYERAGMRVVPNHTYAVYRKELLPGRERMPAESGG